MVNVTNRFGRRLPRCAPAAVLMLGTPLLAACDPICGIVNSWSACYAGIHGGDASELHSEIEETPASEYADAVDQARPVTRAVVVDRNLPGLSLAVGMDDKIVWAEGFGWADIAERRPVTPQTSFRVGSVAQPMTATAVGLLLERGLVDLDAPVRDYVPGFPEKEWPVTTRQLMGHVAGVRDPPFDEERLYMRDHCESPFEGLALFARDPLLFAPGTRYQHSTYGWTLVGAVVEAAAGRPFIDFMQEEVFDPSDMPDTVVDDVFRPAATRTSFYWPFAAGNPGYGVEDANDADTSCLQGAGALLSTPSDLVRFGLAILAGRLLGAETLAMLRTPLDLQSGESTGNGLGWFVRSVPLGQEVETTTIFGYSGTSVGGFTAFLTVPEHGIVVAVTTNVSLAADRVPHRFLAESVSALSLRLAGVFADNERGGPS